MLKFSGERKSLFENYASISLLQFAKYLLPLITIPYIVRIIGPEKFGLINIAQSIIAYSTLIVNYGFDITATREIALNRDNKEELSRIFYEITYSKTALFLITTVIYLPLLFFVNYFSSDIKLYIYTYIINIGFVLFPTWYFQGTGNLKKASIFNFFIKVIFTAAVFIFIKKAEDYLLINLISSIGQILAGIISFMYVIKKYNLKFSFPKAVTTYKTLKSDFTYFTSTIIVNLYTTSNLVLLGFFAPAINAGYFSVSYKLIAIVESLLIIPFSQSLFPHIGWKLKNDKENGMKILRKAFMLVLGIGILVTFVLYIFAAYAVNIMFGKEFMPAVASLKILSAVPMICALSNVIMTQCMMNLKMDKIILLIMSIAGALSLTLNFLLIPQYKEIGVSVSWLITEIVILLSSFYYMRMMNIQLLDFKLAAGTLKNIIKKAR